MGSGRALHVGRGLPSVARLGLGTGTSLRPPPPSPPAAVSQRTSSRAHVIAPSLSSLEEHAKPRHFGQEDRVVAARGPLPAPTPPGPCLRPHPLGTFTALSAIPQWLLRPPGISFLPHSSLHLLQPHLVPYCIRQAACSQSTTENLTQTDSN